MARRRIVQNPALMIRDINFSGSFATFPICSALYISGIADITFIIAPFSLA